MGMCCNACVVDVQVARADELHQQATKYCAQLQEFNGRLQSDSQAATERLKTLQACARLPAQSGNVWLHVKGAPAQYRTAKCSLLLADGPAAGSCRPCQQAEVMHAHGPCLDKDLALELAL